MRFTKGGICSKAIIVPIYKSKDKQECGNYRGISLLSIPSKVYTKILQQRLKKYVEKSVSDEQAGFRKGRGTIDQLFVIRQLAEKYWEKKQTLFNNFIDFKQAFDSVWQKGLWQVLRNFGIPEDLIQLLEDLYRKTVSAVRVDGELTEWFKVTVGVRQGCNLSPYLFNLILEAMMIEALKNGNDEIGVTLYGQKVNNLRFADDIDLVANSSEQLQTLTDRIRESSKRFGLKINTQKTKTMSIGKHHETIKVTINGEDVEQVEEFTYLGGVVTEDGRSTKDIKRRIGLASAAFGQLTKMWKSDISLKIKLKLYETLVVPVLMYGAECWTMRKAEEQKILVAEMNWLRRILGKTRRDRIRNEVIRKVTNQKETLVDRIRQRRLMWFGHVHRMENTRLPARALYGHVEGTRSKGRQRKTWMDNVREDLASRGLDMRTAIDKTRDRTEWRRIAKTSSSAQADG